MNSESAEGWMIAELVIRSIITVCARRCASLSFCSCSPNFLIKWTVSHVILKRMKSGENGALERTGMLFAWDAPHVSDVATGYQEDYCGMLDVNTKQLNYSKYLMLIGSSQFPKFTPK